MKYYIEDSLDREIELMVEYDYFPNEKMTRTYPGSDAEAEVCEVIMPNGAEVCLLAGEIEKVECLAMETELENEVEIADYKRYGYMLY